MRSGLVITGLRAVVGFLVAPLAPGLLADFIGYLDSHGPIDFWATRLAMMVGYPTAIFIGIPVFCVLAACRWTSFLVYLAMGLIMGAAVQIVAMIIQNISLGDGPLYLFDLDPRHFVLPIICATIATISFWIIVYAGRRFYTTKTRKEIADSLS